MVHPPPLTSTPPPLTHTPLRTQMGILALMMHECVDGKPYIFFDL